MLFFKCILLLKKFCNFYHGIYYNFSATGIYYTKNAFENIKNNIFYKYL